MDSREAPAPAPPQHQSGPPNMMVSQGPYTSSASMANNNNHHHHHHHHHHNNNPMIGTAHMMGGGGGGPARFPFNSVSPPSQQQQQQPASKPVEPMASSGGGGHPYDGSSPTGMRPSGAGGSGGAIGFTIDSSSKKKRGRPRKYSPDGNIALGLTPTPMSSSGTGGGGHGDSAGTAPSSDPSGAKKHRGRPPGSGKKQLDALGSGGIGFTPHVILVQTGEDIASKVMEFSQQGPRTVCILSANGAICNVAIRQPTMTGGVVSYEGRFEIISLSGSFSLSENNGHRTRTSNLCISLAGPDGRVVGGGVAGSLMAASPVQVIVGSFLTDAKKSGSNNASMKSVGAGGTAPQPQMLNFGAHMATGSPPSHGDSSESSEDNNGNAHTTSLNRGPGFYNNATQLHNMHAYNLWNGQTQQ